jgi:hypothetical protein
VTKKRLKAIQSRKPMAPLVVAREVERQNSEAIKGEREIAKRAGKIAENTPAYDPMRKSRR